MSLFYLIVLVIILILIFRYHWSRRHLYFAASKYNGPVALPFVGNAHLFLCKNKEILERIYELINKYQGPLRFWMGPKLLIIFKNPSHVEKILSSSKLTYKHEVYDFLKIYLGDGLITGSGPKYKSHKKIIQPLFDIRFCSGYLDVFQKHANICVDKVNEFMNKNTFDIHHIIHNCFINIIGETVLGVDLKAYGKSNKKFLEASTEIYDFGFTRLIKPWLHPDIIYNNTSYKTMQDNYVATITSFIQEAIIESWKRRKMFVQKSKISESSPIIDQIASHIEKNPEFMNSKDFISHLISLYAASEDTMTIIASLTCVCLGMYPEYQKKVAEEIYEIFGEEPREITMDDISKLNYLDMCIKDVLRLAPIGPFILRSTRSEIQIDKYLVPKGCGVLVPIFNLHRDPNEWENPNHFHPDHFLPEAVRKRQVYSYLPFSAGPRGCIGKILANVGIKIVLIKILQTYEITAEGKFPNVKLQMDISVRPVGGYNVRLKKRIWK